MASEFEHASPDEKHLVVHLNHAFATLITMISEGMIGIANDRNALVFEDKDGYQHKTLQDSTEDGVIPENSVVYIDSSGKATYNANFKIDISNGYIQFPNPFIIYIGDPSTNGSYRIKFDTDGIKFGKRESGSWTEIELT